MSGPERRFVTVVSGLPRSGTSLVMQMLRAGGMPVLTDDLRPPDEDNPRGYLEYEPVKGTREDASWVERAMGRAVKVVHLLLPALPPDREYRVLLTRRPIREVMASQEAMLERRREPVGDTDGSQLAHLFERQIQETEAWLRATPYCRVLPVAYHDLLRDPKQGAAAIDRFLGGGLDVDAMASCVEPTLRRQRV